MGKTVLLVMALIWVLALPEAVNCKRILIIAALPLYSHQIVFQSLSLALHKRGHELVVAAMPVNETLSNYTKIDISYLKDQMHDVVIGKYHLSTPIWEVEKIMWLMHNDISKELFENLQIRRLYTQAGSNEKFDLVIIEACIGAALLGFAHRFHAPLIAMTTNEMFQYTRYLLGDLLLPSFPSNWEFDRNSGFDLSFWQRTVNYLEMLAYIYRWTYIYMPQQQAIAQKYLGINAGDLYETIKNISLVFTSRSNTFIYVKPEVPNIISFDSVHIMKEPPSLSKNLKHFLDGATEGFVHMSLGSTFKPRSLPKDKINAIVNAFSKLPYRVLWKFHEENLPGKPDNVFTMKWIPQQGVLAHPNIKVFVYQGGVQSTDEAIHYAVPLVGIPLMFDQGYIINRLVEKGVARRLDYRNLSDTDLVTAIRNVFDDKRYKENMILLSEITKDKPVDDIEKLVWWTEYVMRHNGAPHLRYRGANQPFYQRHDTDIIAFLAITIFTITMFVFLVLIKCLRYIVRIRVLLGMYYKTCQTNVKKKDN